MWRMCDEYRRGRKDGHGYRMIRHGTSMAESSRRGITESGSRNDVRRKCWCSCTVPV